MFRTQYDKKQQLWSGVNTPPLFNPTVSLGQMILHGLSTQGTRLAQISDDTGVYVRFDELRSKSIRVAQNLRARGYKKDQIFGFIGSNSTNVAPVVFASFYLGCPINTLDPSFGKNEIKHMLNTIKPCLMFCDVNNYELLKECLNELENDAAIFTFRGQIGDSEPVENLLVEQGDEYEFVPTAVDGEKDIAVIICSSGTTGLSKGVCISHAGLSDTISRFGVMNADDVILCFSSLYWITGVMFLIAGAVTGAKRIITTQPSSPELQFRIIEQYKVTVMLNSPFQTTMFIKSDAIKSANLSSVKHYFTGGGRVPKDIVLQINQHLPNGNIHIVYGLSEVAGVVAADFPHPHGNDTTGQLVSGMHVKIVDDNGNRCGVGVDGEVCLKGSHRFLGYYKNQAANDELFDSEGFLVTGDIAHFDEDGFLYIVDRKREMLKYRGSQLSPSYIEGHLIKSPLIQSVCICGIWDDIDGDLVTACIVRDSNSNLDEAMVHKMIDENFADYCKLRGGVYFVESMPTTPSGKILRRKVKETVTDLYNKKKQG